MNTHTVSPNDFEGSDVERINEALEAAAGTGRAGEIILVSELLKRGVSPGAKEFQREGYDLRNLLSRE